MINNKKVLGLIPARGGSKGVPRKNIRMLAGKPLIAWTIEEAQKSKHIDRLVLSSEDEEIIEVAKSFGCEVPFVRPIELAADDTPGIAPVLHALRQLPSYDIVVMLQPTSPLRTVQDIDESLNFFVNNSAHVCVSISEVTKNPYWMFTMDEDNYLEKLLERNKIVSRRQDLPKIYTPNGALFIAKNSYLLEKKSFYTKDTTGYVMPKERAFDIDDEFDFIICENIGKYSE